MESMSLEEFGSDLFEAIKCKAGIRQAERLRKIYQAKGSTKQLVESEATIKALNYQLLVILRRKTIDGPDLKRLLAM